MVPALIVPLGQLDLTPNSTHNEFPGVGGKGQPALGVIALDGTPQANTASVERL